MSTHAGSEGIIVAADKRIAEVKSWNLEEVSDTVDASIIGTQWRKHQATIKSWSGSIDAFWDTNEEDGQNLLRIGETVMLRLFPEGADEGKNCFMGSAIITGISRQASFDGLVESSFTFQGNAKLKYVKAGHEDEEEEDDKGKKDDGGED